MFEIITKRNKEKEKSIIALETVLEKAESQLEELDKYLNEALNDGDIDRYSQVMNDRNIRESFVIKTREKMEELKSKPAHRAEDLEQIKLDIQNRYNPKLKKAHKELRDNLNKAIKSFEEYQALNDEFIDARIRLTNLGNAISEIVNVFEGPNKIKNDMAKNYEHPVILIRKVLNNNELE